jgi:hypothetical protein
VLISSFLWLPLSISRLFGRRLISRFLCRRLIGGLFLWGWLRFSGLFGGLLPRRLGCCSPTKYALEYAGKTVEYALDHTDQALNQRAIWLCGFDGLLRRGGWLGRSLV